MQLKRLYYWFSLLGALVLVTSCAKYGNPQGGPKDTRAPRIVEENSTANYQTNFTDREIVIEFDEWIKVNNPLKEVVVSPPTSFPYQVKEQGKKVIFQFSEEEVLKEDATYQINFGEAIKDFTEGNVYENLIYIFSTGDVIDSLSVKGKIIKAIDKSPAEEVLVLLYDDLSDTCFTSTRPFYFTKTNKEGEFQLNNLRSDTFQIFTLKDENVNYYYDLSKEQVGFLDSLIFLTDSVAYDIQMEIFDEEDPIRVSEKIQKESGLIKLLLNKEPEDYLLRSLNDSVELTSYFDPDTLYAWYRGPESSLEFTSAETIDTIKTKKGRKNISTIPLTFSKKGSGGSSFYKMDSIHLKFNKPLKQIDTSKVILEDTLRRFSMTKVSVDNIHCYLFPEGLDDTSTYSLTLLPDAVTDIYDVKNSDTLQLSLNTKNSNQFGKFILDIKNSEGRYYYFEMMKGTEVVHSFSIRDDMVKNISKVEPGNYNLKIIEDLDRNNRWSPGVIKEKKHSERQKEVPLKELTAGWDIELELDIKEIFNGVKSQ